MRIDEISSKGLKREYKIVISAGDIDKKLDSHLEGLKNKIRLPGFRPGKAPTSLIKKLHGKSMMGKVLEEVVNESTQKVFEKQKIKPALQPNIEVLKFDEDSDLEYRMEVEVLPEIKVPDFSKIKLERLVAVPSDKEVDEAVAKLAAQQKRFEAAPKSHKAALGEVVLLDFAGQIDGVSFDGGTGEGHQLELGSGQFIPGFEDQLVGVKAGDERDVTVTFPADYTSKELAGKEALFKVKVHEVQLAAVTKVDDEFAKTLGLDDLAKLKETIGTQLTQELEGISRTILKRALLDDLAERCKFEVPESMIDIEFKQIWAQIKQDMIQAGEATAETLEGLDGPKDPAEHKDFMDIAERRVRLGLLLSEAGQAKGVTLAADEVNRRVMQEAQRYPGQEKEVLDFYTKNDQAMAQLRAPLYEEKVCAAILEDATVKEKKVTRAQLEQIIEAMDSDETPAGEKGKEKKTRKAPREAKGAAKGAAKGGEKKKAPAAKDKAARKTAKASAKASPKSAAAKSKSSKKAK